MREINEVYALEEVSVDSTDRLKKENEELKEKNAKLTKDVQFYKNLYNQYLDSTVKYRGAFKALLEEIKKWNLFVPY